MMRFIAALCLSLAFVPMSSAQEDPRAEISAAVAQFQALESYALNTDSTVRQQTTDVSGRVNLTTTQQIVGTFSGADSQTQFSVEQTIENSNLVAPIVWQLTVDRVSAAETTYLQFSDIQFPPELGANLLDLPAGWFIPEPLGDDFSSMSSRELGLAVFINGYAETSFIPPALNYPLNDETVRVLEVLPDESLDDQPMHVYEISYNALELYLTATQNEWRASLDSFGQSGLDIARFFVEGGLQVRARFWIGVDDGLLHQAEQQTIFTLRPGALTSAPNYGFEQDSRVRVRFTDFNMPVTIAPPALDA